MEPPCRAERYAICSPWIPWRHSKLLRRRHKLLSGVVAIVGRGKYVDGAGLRQPPGGTSLALVRPVVLRALRGESRGCGVIALRGDVSYVARVSHSYSLGIDFPRGKLRSAIDQGPIEARPETWSDRTKYPLMAQMRLPTSIARSNLVDEYRALSVDDDDGLREVFVRTMMWGSGTRNGRGPRNTHAALAEPNFADVLREVDSFVLQRKIADAYNKHSALKQIGPAFHTKWLWVIGAAVGDVDPQPLIQDSLVWAALGAEGLKWSSITAAGGDRSRAQRYVAYLRACQEWAHQHGVSAEDIECSLFCWGKEQRK